MNVFDLRNRLITYYGDYIQSFIHIQDPRIEETVGQALKGGLLWPDPMIQINPAFEMGESVEELVEGGILHPACRQIFLLIGSDGSKKPLRLYKHQAEAIKSAHAGTNYVLTTGTGSGKSLSYIIPIVDHILREGSGKGIRGLIVYPMNALANSQLHELERFLSSSPGGKAQVTFARYTGQEQDEERQRLIANPPDILLTNYVMLELLLTRPYERALIAAAKGLRFFVLDELHTYRGRQGADVAMLVRRAKDAFGAEKIQYVGTSATIAGSGTLFEQQAEVAAVATRLFGSLVQPEHIIGESVRRATPSEGLRHPGFSAQLRQRIEAGPAGETLDYRSFLNDPLSVWIESVFGLASEPGTGRPVRAKPRSIGGEQGAAKELSELTGLTEKQCVLAMESHLLSSYRKLNPETGFPVFAFRLHQFISRGDTIYASIEPENQRYLAVQGQRYVPGDRKRVLLPLVFCRECGQEYYCVRVQKDETNGLRAFSPRALSDRFNDEEGEPGFLYLSSSHPWPTDPGKVLESLPEDCLEEFRGSLRVRKDRQEWIPKPVRVSTEAVEGEGGTDLHYVPAPFHFCLACGVAYGARQRSDFAKLTSLATEGRSTATTILSLAAIRYLKKAEDLPGHARKLLSFTDNRQDASLQAGHFNDFLQIGVLRSALYKAVKAVGQEGLSHEFLVERVFEALNLPLEFYASNSEARFQALEETKRALRWVLGYRLYRDLERGWRVTLPNLEQCGLLEIRYRSLDELCQAEDVWKDLHPALASAKPETRMAVAKTLLDYMRREMAIKVDYLDPAVQERIQQMSSQHLISPWAIDENETMEPSTFLYPRPSRPQEYKRNLCLSPRGGFGQYLRRGSTFTGAGRRLNVQDSLHITRDLLKALQVAGLVEAAAAPKKGDDVPGYQLLASALVWTEGDGQQPFYDPIRVPRPPADGGRTNPFFVDFYRNVAADGIGLEAREHTAQVRYEVRQDREERFREGRLPILFCSPTMELGVDIAELNVVNLRNVPPTPANYAQRSGRAGRSGRPALVFSYCSTFSSHDQYFFRRPDRMVTGQVMPPQLDLTNEDLIRAHVHAIWLAETGIGLGTSLKDVLDLSGEEPSFAFQSHIRDAINDPHIRERALVRARRVLDSILPELATADWYSEGWLGEVLAQAVRHFDVACERWRTLYRAASRQRDLQHRIISDATRSQDDKNRAKRLRAEAEAQLDLLREAQNAIEADFYSYRYFASEGFLPGYSFPRLPLSAYIPGRRQMRGTNEFLSRPRFLAISEFGPQSIIYHEGSRYKIDRVILPVRDDSNDLVTTSAKQCDHCGYLHPISGGGGPDLCDRCGGKLPAPLASLFRLQNVSTRRKNQINSDEEERVRQGFELQTGVRFAEHGQRSSCLAGQVVLNGDVLADLTYGHTATLWRINLGWRRRAEQERYGFVLDVERGFWAKNEQDVEDDDQDVTLQQTRRVIPYVEDRRNCLLFQLSAEAEPNVLASLQAALKNAIQVEYQLEESELAAEALPSWKERRLILFYEAAEGGAGVLRRLLEPGAMARLARRALELCHYDPDTGEDKRRVERAQTDCEAACYDCLMSYTNQMDHRLLDRQSIRELLLQLSRATGISSSGPTSRSEHLAVLIKQCGSDLEREWLRYLDARDLRLPSRAQCLVETCRTRPDFLYEESQAAIYIDGPPHTYPERQQRDHAQTACMEDAGYTVIRFNGGEDWDSVISKYPHIFGRQREFSSRIPG